MKRTIIYGSLNIGMQRAPGADSLACAASPVAVECHRLQLLAGFGGTDVRSRGGFTWPIPPLNSLGYPLVPGLASTKPY